MPPFTQAEFEARVERVRAAMARDGLDAAVVTSEANMEYLSGFETQFAWSTPTRPWYFVVPRDGDCTAIIPEIGETNWLTTSWCRDVLTWPSPRPADEGVTLLGQHLAKLANRSAKVGFEIGPESRLGMPVADLLRLREASGFELVDCALLMARLRLVKSEAEVGRIRHTCGIAGRTFDALPSFVAVGDSEKEVCRRFAANLLLNGADKAAYTAIASGPGGYRSIITGPTDRRVQAGDVLVLDTGARCGGYFCDFDRNYCFGGPSAEVRRLHDILWLATEAGIRAARPGKTAADVFHAQARVLQDAGIGVGNVGRFGHGLGKLLTEFPSIAPGDQTVLRPGMVLTIEPSAMFGDGQIMAHEEDIVVTDGEPDLLTRRAAREMTRVG